MAFCKVVFKLSLAPAGEGTDSCADPPATPPIDVAALSVGMPDGVYYAGRQLTPWMPYKEISELCELRYRHRERMSDRGDRERRETLMARREGQSIVVKWTIERGRPSTPTPVKNRYTDGLGDDTEARAFTWNSGSSEDSTLTHCLLSEAIETHDASSNDYYHDAAKIVKSFGETWLLPQRRLQVLIVDKDLRVARARLDAQEQRARALGLDPAALLREIR